MRPGALFASNEWNGLWTAWIARRAEWSGELGTVAYIGGCYRDKRGIWHVQENIREAEAVALELWQHGIPALCPHKNTAFFDGAAPDSVFLEGDLEMLARCDVMILVPGWLHSAGTLAEVKFAKERGIEVHEHGCANYYDWLNETRMI